jgi:hypothetical protein
MVNREAFLAGKALANTETTATIINHKIKPVIEKENCSELFNNAFLRLD